MKSLWLVVCIVLGFSAVARAENAYVRLQAEPEALQTAVVQLRGPKGARVDLVAAVHLGESSYYHDLNTRFRGYDRVLYELVKPEEFEPAGTLESRGSVGGLQGWLKNLLGLSFQLEEIDYGAANFVHADMASERLVAELRRHPGKLIVELFRWTAAEDGKLRNADGSLRLGTLDLALAWLARDRQLALRKVLARELAALGDLAGGSSLLIGERNAIAVQVAQRELKRRHRHLAVFYGAGHMPDLEKRFAAMGFRRTGEQWLTAWKLTPR